jgi:hypothetical protein
MSQPADPRPVREIVAAISRDLLLLIAQLITIARAEIGEAVGGARSGAVTMAIGAALLVCGALTMVSSLVLIANALGLPAWASALTIGALLTVAGGVTLQIGVGAIRGIRLTLPETRGALIDGVEWLKTLRR